MKNAGNSSNGRSQEVPKVSWHPCIGRMGALRGHLCDNTAFLSHKELYVSAHKVDQNWHNFCMP